ncbi:hypothetical protein PFISCL1PPCAC_27790, partial [Pristionchus fissidentatus]
LLSIGRSRTHSHTHFMDGQRSNINGSKDVIPGVAGNNVFLPSLFAQPQISSSTHAANPTNLQQWTKHQTFQNVVNWVDQTKNLPMYNMFSGNMAANGTFDSNAWQNASSSQSNMNLATNPLLAAFQQQSLGYMGNKTTTNASSTTFNPLQQLRQPTFDPLNLHATTVSTLNPPISQPKQPPKTKSNDSSIFNTSVPSTSGSFIQHQPSAQFPIGYDKLKEKLNATLQQQPTQQMQQPFPSAVVTQPQFPAAAAATP